MKSTVLKIHLIFFFPPEQPRVAARIQNKRARAVRRGATVWKAKSSITSSKPQTGDNVVFSSNKRLILQVFHADLSEHFAFTASVFI